MVLGSFSAFVGSDWDGTELGFRFGFGGSDRPDCCWDEKEGNWGEYIAKGIFIPKIQWVGRSMKGGVAGGALFK